MRAASKKGVARSTLGQKLDNLSKVREVAKHIKG